MFALIMRLLINALWLAMPIALLCSAFLGVNAEAHLLNMSKIQVDIDAERQLKVDVQVDMTRSAGGGSEYYRLSRLPQPLQHPEVNALLEKLARATVLTLNGTAIPLRIVGAELPALPEPDFLSPVSWPMTHVTLVGVLPLADTPQKLQGLFTAEFHFEEPIALTFMVQPEGRSMTRWLVAGQTSPLFELAAGAESVVAQGDSNSLWQYMAFGFTHILPKGIDHVLFVLGLYLGARNFKSLLLLITCFTLAHSITLGLAGLGLVQLSPKIVEPLIALSIVWVGIENFFASATSRYRPWIVFGFGLLHGMGFASALAELKLSKQHFLLDLLSFNVGIELGQLTVIAGAMVATLWFKQRDWYHRRIALTGSFLIAGIASVWTVQRILQ